MQTKVDFQNRLARIAAKRKTVARDFLAMESEKKLRAVFGRKMRESI